MGRPINGRNFGDTAQAGNQIVITGDIGAGIFTGFIVRQKSTREFIANINGTEGRVRLVNNASPGVGEAFIEVFESGSDADGSGADFDADMHILTISIADGGTGYAASDTLTVVGGTSTTVATFNVDSVSGGVITGISINADPANGDYQVLAATPNSPSGGTGSGASINIDTWGVDTPATSAAGGTLYDQAPVVTISGGGGTGATATATVAAGAVTVVTIDTAGSAFTSIPTISFVNAGRKFVERIKDNKVNATDGVQTQWDNTLGATPPAGQSRIVAS